MSWRDDGDRSLGHRPPHGLLFHGREMAGKGATAAAGAGGGGVLLLEQTRSIPHLANHNLQRQTTWPEKGQKWSEMI